MKKLLLTTTAVVALSVAANANAGGSHEGYAAKNAYKATDEAWYVSISGLADILQDQSVAVGSTRSVADADTGYGALVAVGHEINLGFGKGARAELELGYRTADADTSAISGGTLKSYSALANVYYDFTNNSPWTPYVGVGAGAAQVENNNFNSTTGRLDDSDVVFAYQGIAGVNYAFTREWSAQLEYRYYNTTQASLTSSTGASSDYNYATSNAVLGLKYKFY